LTWDYIGVKHRQSTAT